MLRITAVIVCSFYLAEGHCQTYDHYFLSKIKADSLIAKGDYINAIPYLRVCVSEPAMTTVDQKFFLGYALFKSGVIDTAGMYMTSALSNGYYFRGMTQYRYWEENGVFERMGRHESTAGVGKSLKLNTTKYAEHHGFDSVLRDQLLKVRERDQEVRRPGADVKKMLAVDEENQIFLRDIINKRGWPSEVIVGGEGSNAAFLIAQHSDNDAKFQNECLEHIRQAYFTQTIDPAYYAYIIDRTRVNAGRPQVFGTQYDRPIENPKNVNLRRKVVGLGTLEDYLSKRR